MNTINNNNTHTVNKNTIDNTDAYQYDKYFFSLLPDEITQYLDQGPNQLSQCRYFRGSLTNEHVQKIAVRSLLRLRQDFECGIIRSYEEGQPKDIEALINTNDPLSTKDLAKLRAYMIARDKLTIWKFLATSLMLPSPITEQDWANFSLDSNSVIQFATGFEGWCKDNESSLLKINQLLLSSRGLTSLPDELRALKNLTNLNLNSNNFTFFPKIINKFKILDKLAFFNNSYLNTISTEINLSNLTSITLKSCNFDHFPSHILKSKFLNYLNLSENKLEYIPPQISDLDSLTDLNLSHNDLSELPSEIVKLEKLTSLQIINNEKLKLPKDFKWPPNLKVIPNG